MIRRPPVLLSLAMLVLLPLARGGAQDLLPPSVHTEQVQETGEGMVAVTRSDGSKGLTRAPDQKEIRKLVSLMREGINRADRSERQKETRRTQSRRIWIRK